MQSIWTTALGGIVIATAIFGCGSSSDSSASGDGEISTTGLLIPHATSDSTSTTTTTEKDSSNPLDGTVTVLAPAPAPAPTEVDCAQDPVDMANGEMVSYLFQYSNGTSQLRAFTRVAGGAVVQEIDGHATHVFHVDGWCGDDLEIEQALGDAAFLFSGGILIPVAESDVDGEPLEPYDSYDETCAAEPVTQLIAGTEFLTTSCTYESDLREFTYTMHEHGDEPTPLAGLLRYQLRNTDLDVVVELTAWNGL